MRRFIPLLLVFAFCFTGCLRYGSDVAKLPPGKADHTVIMYLWADNNLAASIIENSREAESAMNAKTLPTGRLLIYLDSADTTTLYEVHYRRYGSADFIKESNLLKAYPKQCSTDPAVMKQVLNDIKRMAPSRSYGIILSGHGSGWFPKPSTDTTYMSQRARALLGEYNFAPMDCDAQTKWIGNDNHNTDDISLMSAEDLVEGLSPIHFEYIIFDACFMSSIEFLYDLRGSADYIVAAPTEVMNRGYTYGTVIPALLSSHHSLTDIAGSIVDTYRNTSYSTVKSVSIAVIDCSRLENLADKVRRIYSSTLNTVDLGTVQHLERMLPHAFYDMNGYLSALCGDPAAYAEYLTAFSEAVLYAGNTDDIFSYGCTPDGTSWGYAFIEQKMGGSLKLCGVSCYVPIPSAPITAQYYRQTAWAKAVGAE